MAFKNCFADVTRFHMCVFYTWQFGLFFAAQMIFPIFANFIPRWRCRGVTPILRNASISFSRDCTIFEQCTDGNIEFEAYIPFQSAALEFGWICGTDAYKRALFSQAQFVGVLVGTLTFGAISDAVGRKPVSLLVLGGGVLATLASAFAPSWQLLLGARLVVGFCVGGTIVVVNTFVNELILPGQRMLVRGFFGWGIARLGLTLLCLAFPDWRSASIACALCTLPAFLIVLFVLPESPTWLHSKGRLEQMRANEARIARFSGQTPVEREHKPVPAKESSLRSLLKEKQLLKRVVVLWFMWWVLNQMFSVNVFARFTASTSSYFLDLNSSNISGDFFLNQTLFSLLLTASKISLFLVDTGFPNFSRRNLHQWSQLVVITAILTLLVLVLSHHDGIGILVANLAGVVFVELTWFLKNFKRATSAGSCSLVARIGALIAPVLVFLNTLWPVSAYFAVLLLGSMNLLVSWFWLVETKGIDLDQVHLDGSGGNDVTKCKEAELMLNKDDGKNEKIVE